MTTVYKNKTTTGNLTPTFVCRSRKGIYSKTVITASDTKNVQEWIYHYLEPYEAKGYAVYQAENESDFYELVRKADTVIAFVEDVFFGEKTLGKLDYFRKLYPQLHLVIFSISNLFLKSSARFVYWSYGGYLSLRHSEEEIKEAVRAVFRKQQGQCEQNIVPDYLRDSVDKYGRLPKIKPHLTHREIEIVRCTANGKTTQETAAILMLSRRTVQHHLSNVYQKFGIRNIAEVLKLAVSKGIIPVDELMTYTVQG